MPAGSPKASFSGNPSSARLAFLASMRFLASAAAPRNHSILSLTFPLGTGFSSTLAGFSAAGFSSAGLTVFTSDTISKGKSAFWTRLSGTSLISKIVPFSGSKEGFLLLPPLSGKPPSKIMTPLPRRTLLSLYLRLAISWPNKNRLLPFAPSTLSKFTLTVTTSTFSPSPRVP